MRHLFIMATPAIGLTLAMVPDLPVVYALPAGLLGLVVFGHIHRKE